MYTSLDNIQTELRKRLDEIETKLSAWEKVERKRKKDGTSFSALSRNFVNATIHDNQYTLKSVDKLITVCAWTKYSGWITDEIHTCESVKYEKNRKIADDRIVKERFIEPYYIKTVDEIFEDIDSRIEYLKGQKRKIEDDLEASEKVFGEFKSKIDEALKELKASCNQSLYYLCRDYMSGAY